MMRRALQRGFTAIEMMVVLMVTVFALAKGGQELTTYIDNLEYQAVAQHANLVREAGNKYIKDNYAAIQAVATPAAPATITVAMLQSTSPKYLDSAVSATNSFGQAYSILVLEPAAGQLEAMIVTTGGTAIPERGLRYIAQILGQQGGYVSAVNAAVATGLRGGWNKALPGNYGVSPGAGHLAIALFYGDSGTVSDYVYRNSVSGHPELNTMNTPLIMASIQATGEACATTGAIARDNNGALMSCQGGAWKGGAGGLNWKGTLANVASLPAAGNSSGDAYRISGLSNHAFVWDATNSVWQGLVVDSAGGFSVPGIIYTAGASSTYGAVTMQGSKNGWSGINFKDSTGASAGTLMMHPSYSGFFNAADGAWRWYVDNVGNSIQPGNAQSATVTPTLAVAENSSCAGYAVGTMAQSNSTGGLILSCQSDGRWRRDPATQCAAGLTYTGGSCQSIAAYAAGAVPTNYSVIGYSQWTCPSGYSWVDFIGTQGGNVVALCRKN